MRTRKATSVPITTSSPSTTELPLKGKPFFATTTVVDYNPLVGFVGTLSPPTAGASLSRGRQSFCRYRDISLSKGIFQGRALRWKLPLIDIRGKWLVEPKGIRGFRFAARLFFRSIPSVARRQLPLQLKGRLSLLRRYATPSHPLRGSSPKREPFFATSTVTANKD